MTGEAEQAVSPFGKFQSSLFRGASTCGPACGTSADKMVWHRTYSTTALTALPTASSSSHPAHHFLME
ncbi:MAG: hypothetical protein KAG97_01210, partial [Victivallales bacterium]|nr:hypothetical protein [Victivallales bacterium]